MNWQAITCVMEIPYLRMTKQDLEESVEGARKDMATGIAKDSAESCLRSIDDAL